MILGRQLACLVACLSFAVLIDGKRLFANTDVPKAGLGAPDASAPPKPDDYLENRPAAPSAPDRSQDRRRPQQPRSLEVGRNEPKVLSLRPTAAQQPENTHSALFVTRKTHSGDVDFKGRVRTVRQLRVGSPPNPWESAWLVWHYQGPHHFYYLAVKPNGWELGKADPEYVGQQRFLDSGETEFPIGAWHDFEIEQRGDTVTVRLNGTQITKFRDRERPYFSGKVGIYAEDSEIQLTDVTAPVIDDFKDYPLQSSRSDGWRLRHWTAPFLGFGEVAITLSTP